MRKGLSAVHRLQAIRGAQEVPEPRRVLGSDNCTEEISTKPINKYIVPEKQPVS